MLRASQVCSSQAPEPACHSSVRRLSVLLHWPREGRRALRHGRSARWTAFGSSLLSIQGLRARAVSYPVRGQ